MNRLALLFLLLSAVSPVLSQSTNFQCSATEPCAVGCCGPFGICGLGPDFCAPGVCVSSCDAKAECDPANWGPTYVTSETCPLNVCCSQFGFCGTTEEFCGNQVVTNPSCPGGISATQKTIAYYEGWSVTRVCDVMYPEQIPVSAYTHINFAFASIDPNTFSIAPASESDVPLYSRLTALKTLFPNLQVWISIGGWSMNDPDQLTATTFSDLAGSTSNQQAFFASLISFMSTYGFDGVDIDWEYPVAPDRSGRPEDFQNYPVFLQNLRTAFQTAGHNYGLSITMPSSFWYLQNFDIVALEQVVDWFNMMEYDLHGTWDATDVWIGPFVLAHTNLTEIDESLKLLWRNNINPAKVVLGLGFYGRSFTLADPSCSHTGCQFSDGGPAGPCTDSVGTLSYAEIERIIAAGATPQLDPVAAVQTVVYNNGQDWVSFDDATTLKLKVEYANNICLGGTMVWAASLDDASGSAAQALAGSVVVPKFGIGVVNTDALSQCTWTVCGGSCPNGFTGAFSIPDGCPSQQFPRTLCCPNNDVPKCGYSSVDLGALSSSNCVPNECPSGRTLVATTQTLNLGSFGSGNCLTGHLNICCDNDASVSILSGCQWAGSPPNCASGNNAASCPSGMIFITQSLHGDGGDQACTSGFRALCCPNPPPIDPTSCQWFQNAFHGICSAGCPEGKFQMAVDTQGCSSGWGSLCCGIATSLTPRSAGLVNWQNFVTAFFDAGICTPHYGSVDDVAPNDLTNFKRDTSQISTIEMALQLTPLLFLFANPTTISPNPIQPYADIWDAEQANHPEFDDFASLAGITVSQDSYSDPTEFVNEVLCEGPEISLNAQSLRACQTQLCTVASSGALFDRDLQHFNLTSRTFLPDWSETHPPKFAGFPHSSEALEDIFQGSVRMEYFRWFRYRNFYPELEVTFVLGPSPSQINVNLQESTENRYVIAHIHFDSQLSNNHLTITAMNIRHGNQMTYSPRGPNPRPGQYYVPTPAIENPDNTFVCPIGDAWDPTNLPTAINLQSELNQGLITTIMRLAPFQANTDLLQVGGANWQANPTMYERTSTGAPNIGPNGQPTLLIGAPNNGVWRSTQGQSLTFDANGNLYVPPADILNTPGFFTPNT